MEVRDKGFDGVFKGRSAVPVGVSVNVQICICTTSGGVIAKHHKDVGMSKNFSIHCEVIADEQLLMDIDSYLGVSGGRR